jgi:tripartite-type tricarboxylate transporter receptor subunit TctC
VTRRGLLATIAIVGSHDARAAEPWPRGPVRLVCPYAAGSVSDLVARVVGKEFTDRLGSPFVVDNRTGANGAVGARAVSTARPDGQTLLVGAWSMFVVNPHLVPNLGYDPLRDFQPLGSVGSVNYVLVVRPGLGVRSLHDFIAYLKANPDQVRYGSPGVGSFNHLVSIFFNEAAGTSGVHVPYRGGGQVVTDLLGGNLDYFFSTVDLSAQHREGSLIALATTGAERNPDYPGTPTFRENGFAQIDDAPAYYSVLAPVGLPTEIAAKLINGTAQAVRAESFRTALRGLGLTPSYLDPEGLRAAIVRDHRRYGDLMRRLKITVAE